MPVSLCSSHTFSPDKVVVFLCWVKIELTFGYICFMHSDEGPMKY